MFVQAVPFTIVGSPGRPADFPPPQVVDVFSLLGVLGIALILFIVVALTAGLVLGE